MKTKAKLTSLVVSAIAIAIGLLWQNGPLVLGGAGLYITSGIADLYSLFSLSRRFRESNFQLPETTALETVADRIGLAITLTGLVIVVVYEDSTDAGTFIAAGWIIWGGSILLYFIGGCVIQGVAGIPLRMGYGGWKVRGSGRRGHADRSREADNRS